jgi:hypothetical protein
MLINLLAEKTGRRGQRSQLDYFAIEGPFLGFGGALYGELSAMLGRAGPALQFV